MSQGPQGQAAPNTENNATQHPARGDYAASAYQAAQKPAFPEIKDYLLSGIVKVEYLNVRGAAAALNEARLYDPAYMDAVERGEDPAEIFNLVENLCSIKISSSASSLDSAKSSK